MRRELKTWPEHWEDVQSGKKTLEIRKNDRNFQVGDILDLIRYNPHSCEYGPVISREVTHILEGGQFGLEEGYVAMSINELKETKIINDPANFIECNTTECCGIGPIVNENYCPNCGRKIVRK